MKRPIIAALLGAGLAAGLSAAQAADVEAGRELAAQNCASCHGPEGRTPASPEYPVLAGQYRDYLLRTMKAYKSGARENAVMQGMMSGLSERDMENLAAWYASQPGLEPLDMR